MTVFTQIFDQLLSSGKNSLQSFLKQQQHHYSPTISRLFRVGIILLAVVIAWVIFTVSLILSGIAYLMNSMTLFEYAGWTALTSFFVALLLAGMALLNWKRRA
jgi:hypothetical protein